LFLSVLNYLNLDRMEVDIIYVSVNLIFTVALERIEFVKDPLLIDTVIMLLINESPPKHTILLLENIRSEKG
jgi:hypothetical protein